MTDDIEDNLINISSDLQTFIHGTWFCSQQTQVIKYNKPGHAFECMDCTTKGKSFLCSSLYFLFRLPKNKWQTIS